MPSYADQIAARLGRGQSVASAPASPAREPLAKGEDAMEVDGEQAVVYEINSHRSEPEWQAMEVDSNEEEELPSLSQGSVLAVLDTNFLINHSELIHELVHFLWSGVETVGAAPATLLLPKIVLHELDKLKLSSKMIDRPPPPIDSGASSSSRHANNLPLPRSDKISLSAIVRQVSTWLVDYLRTRSLVLRGQRREETLLPSSPADLIPADDRILDVACFWKDRKSQTVLITSDKILTAKALVEGIRVVNPKPATDLRTLLGNIHPELLTLYMRGEQTRRILPAPIQHSVVASPPMPQSVPVIQVMPSHDMPVEDEAMSTDMQLDIEVDDSTGSSPSLDASLPPIGRAFVESQRHLAMLLLIAFRKLLPLEKMATTETAASCLGILDKHWDSITSARPPSPHTTRRSVSAPTSLIGKALSIWAPSSSRSPPPSLKQEEQNRAARLRSQRETIVSLRATLTKNDPASVVRWPRGRFDELLSDYGAVLEVLEVAGGLEAEFVKEHSGYLADYIRKAL